MLFRFTEYATDFLQKSLPVEWEKRGHICILVLKLSLEEKHTKVERLTPPHPPPHPSADLVTLLSLWSK